MFLTMCEIEHLEIYLKIICISFELSVYNFLHFSNGLLAVLCINLKRFSYSKKIFPSL